MLGAGHNIPIRYLPAEPSIKQTANCTCFSLWDIYSYLFFLFIMGASAALIFVMLRERKLARIGVVTRGRVTCCIPNGKIFKVEYEFNTEEGKVIEGSTELDNEYQIGALIPIAYLRKNPKRSNRYPVGGFRIED